VVTRAGVTENDFREIFATVEDCYRAAFEQGLARLSRTVTTAADRQDGWLDRVRAGLVALLGFCDDHRSWASVLLLEAPISAGVIFDCTQQLHHVLARLLDHHQPAEIPAGPPLPTPPLTCELIAGGVFSAIRASMLTDDGGRLVELTPSLMAFIVAPYLGQAGARAELEGRPSSAGDRTALEATPSLPGAPVGSTDQLSCSGQLARVQAITQASRLPIRATHRTRLVLRAIARTPYSNNREIAGAAGLADEGQTSKLLARLQRQGVIENVGIGATRGEPNAWLLTASGRRAVAVIDDAVALGAPRPRGAKVRGAG
jgi:hypothetical protein